MPAARSRASRASTRAVLAWQAVELVLVEQVLEVRKLKRGDAGRREQRGEARHEVVDVRHVGQNVVGCHEIGPAALAHQSRGQRHAEELADHIDLLFPGGGGGACRRLDPKTGNASCLHILQQVAVVGSDLDDEALRPQCESSGHLRDVGLCVRQPRG